MTKSRKSNKLFAVVAVLFALLGLAVWLPGFFGLESYYVKTGSMEPNIPRGSMVYIEEITMEQINPGVDVLLFSNEADNKSFTHRAMYVDRENGLIITKGDANSVMDDMPTPFSNCRGRVVFFVPLWGYVAQAINSFWGKAVIVLIYVIWLAVEIETFKSKKKAVKT